MQWAAGVLMTGCIPVYVRHVCVDLMRLGVYLCITRRKEERPGNAPKDNTAYMVYLPLCVVLLCLVRYRDGVWSVFVGFALLLAVVICWVGCCFG